jgi:hypothetical protein
LLHFSAKLGHFFFGFHHQLNLVQGSVVASSGFSPSRSQLRESNRGPPYQIQRQLPLNQPTIDKIRTLLSLEKNLKNLKKIAM